MISTENVTLQYGKRTLFEDVTIKFNPHTCYGLIGANGAGKSTFLKILAGEIEPNKGGVNMPPNTRLSVLKQNHYEFDEFTPLQTVMMGHKKLYDVMTEKDAIYANPDATDDDFMRAGELEGVFADLDGWNAEPEAAKLLSGLGIIESQHHTPLKYLNESEKVRILLAQALFGNPDVLLLDEPTNGLDIESVTWLENFLMDFENTVIVISHDRHFLDAVCTAIADVDFKKIQLYVGNYSFWYESSQLALRQKQDQNKKTEEKRKDLEEFIRRFSANASKSRQATSRQRLLEKLTLEDITPSSRKYPYIAFKAEREAGDQLLSVENLTKTADDGTVLFKNLSFTIRKGEKVVFLCRNPKVLTTLFDVLMEETKPDSGEFRWGVTTSRTYLPTDNSSFFDGIELNLVDWLRQYSTEKDESFIRGFLGRMLFSGEEALKQAKVLSGGEKVRCMLSRMMLSGANVLLLDEPTNHLDMESIISLNNAMTDFTGTMLFTSHDHQLVQTVANRVIEIKEDGIVDKLCTYDEYLEEKASKTAV
ncbi:MAG: ATP-binding cassette domain-containing protein [Raineya sp.]|jgi:ATPase subunit of ABC transporter with duplicated ATPase domains|nr:ATP-binding cassette domain-containing protein [Raineya sp.]